MKLLDYLHQIDDKIKINSIDLNRKRYCIINIDLPNISLNDFNNKQDAIFEINSTLEYLKKILQKQGILLDIGDKKPSTTILELLGTKKEIEIMVINKINYVDLFFPFKNTKGKENLKTYLNNYSYIAFFNDRSLNDQEEKRINKSLREKTIDDINDFIKTNNRAIMVSIQRNPSLKKLSVKSAIDTIKIQMFEKKRKDMQQYNFNI